MALFPPTLPSAVRDLASSDRARRERSLRTLAEVYWTPVYKYVRLRHGRDPAAAEDLVQSFFARIVEGTALAGHDPQRGRFRTFLRAAVDHHVIDHHRRETAARRGGARPPVDLAEVERELVTEAGDEAFDREWIRRIVGLAVARTLEALARRNKPIHAELFRRFHLVDEPAPTYEAAAAELGISTTDVTNWLHVARRELRRVAMELLRELTASEEELADEAERVFGIRIDDGA